MSDPVKAKCCAPKTAYWLQRGDKVIGHALAMSNGTWMIYSDDDPNQRLTYDRFDSPQAAARWAQRTGLGA